MCISGRAGTGRPRRRRHTSLVTEIAGVWAGGEARLCVAKRGWCASRTPSGTGATPSASRKRRHGRPSAGHPRPCTSLTARSAAVVDLPAALDLAAPAAGRRAARLDELLEAAQVAFDLALHEAERVARLLDRVIRLDIELERHPGSRSIDRFEAHPAIVLGAAGRSPSDDRVRLLLADLGAPRAVDAVDLGVPCEGRVVQLLDALHAVHEPREFLELGPLVVGDADGDFDVGRFDDPRHQALLLSLGDESDEAHRTGWASSHVRCSGGRPDVAQIGPRPTRLRPITALTTTTVITAPMTATTIELMSNGPLMGSLLNSAPARNPPTRAPTMPSTMCPMIPRPSSPRTRKPAR